MLSFFIFLLITFLTLAYLAAGFAIRIGWSQMTADERMIWKVAFPLHGMMFGDVKIPNGNTATWVVLFLIPVAGFVLACLQESTIPFPDRVIQNSFGIWIMGFILIATFNMIQDWFK